MPIRRFAALLFLTALLAPAGGAYAQSNPARRHDFITSTFTFGWAAEDGLPTDSTRFDQLAGIVADADFTTVLCNWASWKLPLLRAHGLDMMINVYGDSDGYHILSDPGPVMTLAASLKDTPGIWGYAVALDLTNLTSGYNTALNNLHLADPNHPGLTSWQAGSWPYAANLTDPDIVSYYYYIWYTNGTPNYKNQFAYLSSFRAKAIAEGVPLQQMPIAYSGPSVDGTNWKNRWSVYTALAYGCQGFHWFLANNWMNSSTFQWNAAGLGMATLNAELKALGPEMMSLTSTGVYSTPTTLTAIGDPKDAGEPAIPTGLAAIPAGNFVQVTGGEVVLAHFADHTVGDTFMLVNHRVSTSMPVALSFAPSITLLMAFNRSTGLWDQLPLTAGVNPTASLTLAPGDGMLLRTASNPLYGDINLDGMVDLQDFSVLKSFFGGSGGWAQGDFTGDGSVDLQDFGYLKMSFGRQYALTAVPEPSLLLLLPLLLTACPRRGRVRA